MDNQPQNRYSIVALVVGGAALVAVIVTGVIQLLINAGALTLPNAQNYTLALQISAVLTVVGFASYIILEPDRIRQFLAGRQARYGSNALFTILAFTGIVFVVNYMMATNADLIALKWDLTENKANTLSPEMISAMESLPGPLTATGFFSQTPTDSARELFDDMRARSNGLFSYSFVNPDKNPAAAKEAGVTGDGKILLEMNGRREIADYADEGEILTALNRILNPEQRAIYFLTGHQEADIEGLGDRPMNRAKDILEKKNFTVKTLNLLAENAIPADAKAIVIAGPKTPLSPAEVDLLNNFVLNGGGLVVMEDPIPLTDFGDSPDPLLDMLSAWGLVLRNDFVVDPYNAASYTSAVGDVFAASHQITRAFVNQNVVLPLTRSIEVKTVEGFTTTSLVETTNPLSGNLAWGETDFAPLESNTSVPEFNDGVDTLGPITLVASSEKSGGGRLVASGSALFATDQGFDAYSNNDLFVNSVAWAAGQEAGVDITTKDPTFRTFKLPGQVAAIFIYIGSICIIPGLVLGAGIYAWAARRRRG
ncbi:MAG: Gldg family protein [Chloroflexota bacterium]